jgi:hypothetical protein
VPAAIWGQINNVSYTNAQFANFKTAFGGNTNALTVDPQFTSNTNLLVTTGSNLDGKATPISGTFSISTDIQGDARNGTTPDIGAERALPHRLAIWQ